MDEGEEGGAELVVSGGDAPVLLELVEEALDHVALPVELLLPAVAAPGAACRVGNVGLGPLCSDVGPDPVGVVGLVGDDGRLARKIAQQNGRALCIVRLTGRDQEAERAALRIDERVDLGREPASAATHATISTPFLAPAAC